MFARLLCAAAFIAVASPALAVTVVSNSPGAPDPGPPAGLTTVADFTNPLAPGVSNTTTGTVFTGSGSVGGQYAAPAGTVGNYQAVLGGATSTFTFANGLSKFSLYWGSVDDYNTLQFLRADNTVMGTFSGLNFPPSGGNQPSNLTNRRITFGFTGAEAVKQVRFSSSQNAFEYDTLAAAGIPEPSTWAMMILGFGLIGGAVRRRRPKVTLAFA